MDDEGRGEGEIRAAAARVVRVEPLAGEGRRRVVATPLLAAVNVLVFAAMVARGVPLLDPGAGDLLRWGASLGARSLHGEPWRLLTSAFVHVGLVHLAFNLWVLTDLGSVVERLMGALPFLALYLVSGLGGSLASAWWHPEAASAGASGAIFGVLGALLALLATQAELFTPEERVGYRRSAVSFFVLNLVLGASIPSIDLSAHAGGLAAGFGCGLLLRRGRGAVARAGLVLGTGAPAVAALFLVAQRATAGSWPVVVHGLEEAERSCLAGLEALHSDFTAGGITADEFAGAIEERILPDWRAAMQELGGVELPPRAADLPEYARLTESWLERLAQGLRANDLALIEEANALREQALSLGASRDEEGDEDDP